MPIQVTFFRTLDGQLFETVEEAVAYENRKLATDYLIGKADIFNQTDVMDAVILALNYWLQPASPLTIAFEPQGVN